LKHGVNLGQEHTHALTTITTTRTSIIARHMFIYMYKQFYTIVDMHLNMHVCMYIQKMKHITYRYMCIAMYICVLFVCFSCANHECMLEMLGYTSILFLSLDRH
jgi:hypothetical protein